MSIPNASSTDAARPRGGFTILEVTIAAAIFATILTIMNQAMVSASLSHAQMTVSAQLDADAHRFIDTIATDIANGAQLMTPAKGSPTATKNQAVTDFIYSISNNFYSVDNNVADDIEYKWLQVGTTTDDNNNLIRTREGKDETVIYGNVAETFGGNTALQANMLTEVGLSWYSTQYPAAPLKGFFLVRINTTGANPHDEVVVGLTLSAPDPASRGQSKIYRSAYARIVLKDTN